MVITGHILQKREQICTMPILNHPLAIPRHLHSQLFVSWCFMSEEGCLVHLLSNFILYRRCGHFSWTFFYTLELLRFRCVGGCWDRTRDCCRVCIDSQSCYTTKLRYISPSTRLYLTQTTQVGSISSLLAYISPTTGYISYLL
jgi:hypothetical protein